MNAMNVRALLLILLGAATGIFSALALRSAQHRSLRPLLTMYAVTLVLTPVLGRAVYWYCNHMLYHGFTSVLADGDISHFSAVGTFAALCIASGVCRLGPGWDTLPSARDRLAPAGLLSLSICRMSALFNTSNRGKYSLANEWFRRLPFMVGTASASGKTEWRLATFALEALVYLLLAVLFLFLFLRLYKLTEPSRKKPPLPLYKGDLFRLALCFYAAVTVVLDSTRYDALYLRSNGFVSLPQLLCVCALVCELAVFSIRKAAKQGGVTGNLIILWILALAFGGVGGFMEYYVQRHGNRFVFAYAVMGLAFLCFFAVIVLAACKVCNRQGARRGQVVSQPRRTESYFPPSPFE